MDLAGNGVYDIVETVPVTHKQCPVTYRSIEDGSFVEDLSAAGRKGVFTAVPLMSPPPAIDGNVVARRFLPWITSKRIQAFHRPCADR